MKKLKKIFAKIIFITLTIITIILTTFSLTDMGSEIVSEYKNKIKTDAVAYYDNITLNISNSIRAVLGLPPKTIIQEEVKVTDKTIKSVSPVTPNSDNFYEIPFYYDGSNAPDNITKEQALSYIKKASSEWENACGVSFVYHGDRISSFIDNSNTLNEDTGITKWVDSLDGDTIGEAHVGGEDGYARGFVLSLSREYFKNHEKDLHNVLVHEMGHVIGLPHSENIRSIMYESEQNGAVLQQADKSMCHYYRMLWDGVDEKTARERTGILKN